MNNKDNIELFIKFDLDERYEVFITKNKNTLYMITKNKMIVIQWKN